MFNMRITLIPGLAALTALLGAAIASPSPFASTDMDSHTSTNTTWKGVIEGHAYELQGDASVHYPYDFTFMTIILLTFNSKSLPNSRPHALVSSTE